MWASSPTNIYRRGGYYPPVFLLTQTSVGTSIARPFLLTFYFEYATMFLRSIKQKILEKIACVFELLKTQALITHAFFRISICFMLRSRELRFCAQLKLRIFLLMEANMSVILFVGPKMIYCRKNAGLSQPRVEQNKV